MHLRGVCNLNSAKKGEKKEKNFSVHNSTTHNHHHHKTSFHHSALVTFATKAPSSLPMSSNKVRKTNSVYKRGHGGARPNSGPKPKDHPAPIMLNPFQRLHPSSQLPPPMAVLPSITRFDDTHGSQTSVEKLDGESVDQAPPKQKASDESALSSEHLKVLSEYEQQAMDDDDDSWENATGDEDDTYLDDDYSSDSDDDISDEGKYNHVTTDRSTNKYMPPKGSQLYTYLHNMKVNILADDKYTMRGAHWVPPTLDPISKGRTQVENWAIMSEAWIYVWLPSQQYRNYLSHSSTKCIYCNNTGVGTHEYRYRPFFNHDRIDWVLHCRVKCTSCKRYFTELDPKFFSSLPTTIAERFPYISVKKGPGIHRSMMVQFLSLCTEGVLFSTYAKSVNINQRYRYDLSRVGYLDSLSDDRHGITQYLNTNLPVLYPSFFSLGEFNGIEMTTRMMKRFFLTFMKSRETYLQESFIFCNDEGVSTDHSHKFSRKIYSGKRQLFNASYNIMSLAGQVSSLRLTFGKSNDELEPVLSDLKTVRHSIGINSLERFETDNIKGDGGLWMKTFPELKAGVCEPDPQPFTDTNSFVLEEKQYQYIHDVVAANIWASTFEDELSKGEKLCIGLDTEWNASDGGDAVCRILQLSLDNVNPCVFNLHLMGVSDNARPFPSNLKDLLQSPNIVACGVNIGIDCSKLEKYFGIKISNRIELSQLALKHSPNQEDGVSLKSLCKKYLNVDVDKSHRLENWCENPLPKEMIKYAAIDALLSKKLADALLALTQEGSDDPIQVDSSVDVVVRGRVIARGVVTFLGGGGLQKKWGGITIGTKKAIIKLSDEPYASGYKVPIPHLRPNITTFGHVWLTEEKLTAVFIASLRVSNSVPPGVISNKVFRPAHSIVNDAIGQENMDIPLEDSAEGMNNCGATPLAHSEKQPSTKDKELIQMQDKTMVEGNARVQKHYDDEEEIIVDSDNDDNNGLYSRSKEDIFHQFKALPLPKTSPIRKCVMELVIMATFAFVHEDYESYTNYLKGKMDLEDDDLIRHFLYNKEEWRKYVRMVVYPPETYCNKIKKVHHFVRSNEQTKPYYTDDVDIYFLGFESKARKGLFQEIDNVQMFQWAGVGKGGLSTWYRKRGTVRNENLHQKLSTCLGAYGVGAEVGHHLLLLLAYKYNISTGVKRLGLHSHGHFFHELIDRIQIRIQEVFGVIVYQNHRNLLTFSSPVVAFIAIGVGPLSYDTNYVTFGPVHPKIKGDVKFVARKMGIELPPLPISTKEERKLFNEFRRDNCTGSKLGPTKVHELCTLYKSKADGVSIFPKIPSQIQSYEVFWGKHNIVRTTMRKMKLPYQSLLMDLSGFIKKTQLDFLSHEFDFEDLSETVEDSDYPESTDMPDNTVTNHVPSITAPLQKQYVITEPAALSIQEKKICAFYPLYCKKMARECGGYSLKRHCRTIDDEKIILPENYRGLLFEAKQAARNEDRRVKKAAKLKEK